MPKYLALYDALSLNRPLFAHLPHIMAPSGNKKLGKRDGAKSVSEYRDEGYLPEAMVNFLACLGWNDGTEQDIFTMEELIQKFSFSHVQKSGARFDEKRLLWLNGQWIKRLEVDDLLARCGGFWGPAGKSADSEFKKRVITVVQDRLKTLADLPNLSEYFFARPVVNWSLISDNKQLSKRSHSDLIGLLNVTYEKLSSIEFDNENNIQSALNDLLEQTGEKPPIMFGIVRFALTWAKFSPGLPETMMLLGKDETLARLKAAINS